MANKSNTIIQVIPLQIYTAGKWGLASARQSAWWEIIQLYHGVRNSSMIFNGVKLVGWRVYEHV